MKAYTVNNHLVGVGNDQILGTDQGGGGGVEYEAGQYISIDENNVISVTGISAGNGTLSIVQNVTGTPLEITYPTDVAPDAVFYQIDSVTGNAYSNTINSAVINYYYGETPADFNGSDDSILFTINDNISNINSIYFYYTRDATDYGGPSLTTSIINGGSTGILQSGTYKLKARYNQAGTSSPYGKYLQIMFNWRIYASDYAQSLQWAQEALSKITFFGVVRPDPTLGVTVNLDRYYLGNTVISYTLPSELACQVTVDSTTKQQTVYLPDYMPDSWTNRVAQYVEYGSNRFSPGGLYDGQQYIAYKRPTVNHYLYAFCTDNDVINRKMTFICYNESGQAIEKWTVDYYNYSSNVWTTETITPDMSEYITEGDLELNGDNQVTAIDGHALAVPAAQVNSDWNAASGVAEILNKPTEIQLIAGANVQVEVTGASAIISAQGGGGGVTKTLLYTGSSSDSRKGSFTLSQSGYNFDRLEMTLIDVNNFVIKQICEMPADNLVNSNGTRGSSFNSITSGTQTWFKAMNWQLNAAGTTLTYWVDEISTSGNSISAINRDQTGNRPIMLRIYGVKD